MSTTAFAAWRLPQRCASRFTRALVLMLCVACDPPTAPPGVVTVDAERNGTLTASVSGAQFTGNGEVVAGYLPPSLTVGPNGVWSLKATQVPASLMSATKLFFINIQSPPGPRTIDLSPESASTITYGEWAVTGQKNWGTKMPGGSGTITFTELSSTRVRGTFSVVLAPDSDRGTTGTKTITNGSFDITIK